MVGANERKKLGDVPRSMFCTLSARAPYRPRPTSGVRRVSIGHSARRVVLLLRLCYSQEHSVGTMHRPESIPASVKPSSGGPLTCRSAPGAYVFWWVGPRGDLMAGIRHIGNVRGGEFSESRRTSWVSRKSWLDGAVRRNRLVVRQTLISKQKTEGVTTD